MDSSPDFALGKGTYIEKMAALGSTEQARGRTRTHWGAKVIVASLLYYGCILLRPNAFRKSFLKGLRHQVTRSGL